MKTEDFEGLRSWGQGNSMGGSIGSKGDVAIGHIRMIWATMGTK